jgi:hypothetical protein
MEIKKFTPYVTSRENLVFPCFTVGMRTRKREIARAGVYGTEDNPKTVTAKDIKELAETFADIKTAPVQFGHTADAAAPRLGNVVSVYCDAGGKSLYADIEEDDVLAGAVDAGYYPDVSIGAKARAGDGKMSLRHPAYLGQEAPAVKNMIAKIKEPLGIAAADAEGITVFPPPRELQLSDQTNAKKGDNVTKEEAEKLQKENERLKAELEKREIALSETAARYAGEGLKAAMDKAGMPLPQQNRFLQIASALEPGKIIELSDGSGGVEKMSAMDALIKAVSAIPPPVQTGMLNLSDLDGPGSAGRDYSRLRNKG